MSVEVVSIITIFVAFWLYYEINKITKKIDENEENPDLSRYIKFCDIINDEISKLLEFEKNSKNTDEILRDLGVFSKELVFIQNSYYSNKNSKTWDTKLGEFLAKFDEFVRENFGEEKSDEIREILKDKF